MKRKWLIFVEPIMITDFELRLPIPGKVYPGGYKLIRATIKKGEEIKFKKEIRSFKNNINFLVPKEAGIADGKDCTLELEAI